MKLLTKGLEIINKYRGKGLKDVSQTANGKVPNEQEVAPAPGSHEWAMAERHGHVAWLGDVAKKAFSQLDYATVIEATKIREEYLRSLQRDFDAQT